MKMIAIKFCPDCGQVLPEPPFFCNWCGSCLNKTCLKCEIIGFSKYCTQCGSEMMRANVKAKLDTSKLNKIVTKPIIPISSESTKSSKIQNSSNSNDITIKVKILKGLEMKEIKLEHGGGCRHIVMDKKDSFEQVKSKIIDFYFCSTSTKEKYTSLGSIDKYLIVLLDFKKDDLTTTGHFKTLEKYLKDHGLKPNQGPSFYLHLLERPKFQSVNVEHVNTHYSSQQPTTSFNQPSIWNSNSSTSNQSTYIHSFNKKAIQNQPNKSSNELNEIHNTFLLKNQNSNNSNSNINSKQNQNQFNKSNSSLNISMQNRTNTLNQTSTKTPPKITNTNTSNITYVKNPNVTNLAGTKTIYNSSSDSDSGSDSDSSNSSTSSAVINKKTIKRTNQEINKMKKGTNEMGLPEKRLKLDNKPQINETKIKTEPKEDAKVANNQKTDNLESLCLTPNSSNDNTLNIHPEQNDFNEESNNNRNKNYEPKNYQSSRNNYRNDNYRNNSYYNDDNLQSYRNHYSNDRSRNSSYSRYSNSKYNSSSYNSNNRFNSRFDNSRSDRSSRY